MAIALEVSVGRAWPGSWFTTPADADKLTI